MLVSSQALIIDAIHSLPDLTLGFVVLSASRRNQRGPDQAYHYDHQYFENVAPLVFGLLPLATDMGILWNTVLRLEYTEAIQPVWLIGLRVTLGTLATRELLFRYMLTVAERVRSGMLVANAWYTHSDAASLLTVALSIVGNVLGYQLPGPVAAFVAGLMVTRTG